MSSKSNDQAGEMRGVEHPGVIDMLIHDARADVAVMIMLETRPWDGSELRLFQLQEKFNAYLSFALDGEMAECYPALAGKPLRLRLDCPTPPDETVLQLLGAVRDQIAFQGFELEVRVDGESGCGAGCGCAET